MKRTAMLLRALLVMLFLILLGALAIVDVLRMDSERAFPEFAHLGWPTFIGVVLGFVPVVLALWRMDRLAGLVARDEAFTADTVLEIHRIKQYIVWFMAWFIAGFGAFRVAFGMIAAPMAVLWLLLEVAAAFLFAVVAILEPLFASAVAMREDSELTV